jgi:hypothetical protein
MHILTHVRVHTTTGGPSEWRTVLSNSTYLSWISRQWVRLLISMSNLQKTYLGTSAHIWRHRWGWSAGIFSSHVYQTLRWYELIPQSQNSRNDTEWHNHSMTETVHEWLSSDKSSAYKIVVVSCQTLKIPEMTRLDTEQTMRINVLKSSVLTKLRMKRWLCIQSSWIASNFSYQFCCLLLIHKSRYREDQYMIVGTSMKD